MIELSESVVYEFDEFRLDAKCDRLFRCNNGELVPLTPKTVELLLVLIQSKVRILVKDELIDTIRDDPIVEESNLSPTTFILRKTLSENTNDPRFILTVPNRVDQFIAALREVGTEDKILKEGFLQILSAAKSLNQNQCCPKRSTLPRQSLLSAVS